MAKGEIVSATPETATIAIGHDFDDHGNLLGQTRYAIPPKDKRTEAKKAVAKDHETGTS